MKPALLIFIAAFAGGFVNSISGGGTLITFPVLVWTGMEPVIANATNTVALWPGTIAALVARRHDLRGTARTLLLLAIPCILGGLIGAAILLHTPPRIFRLIVPGLMLFASLVLGAQELLYRNAGRFAQESHEPSNRQWIFIGSVLFFIAVYGGYFGAGIGIMILALLGATGLNDLHKTIALRVFCSMTVNGIAAIYFAASSSIEWNAAGSMAVAQIAGSWIGASVSRKIDALSLRRSIVAFGLVMAALLLKAA